MVYINLVISFHFFLLTSTKSVDLFSTSSLYPGSGIFLGVLRLESVRVGVKFFLWSEFALAFG